MIKTFREMPKRVLGKIANILLTIWEFDFFTELNNQPGFKISSTIIFDFYVLFRRKYISRSLVRSKQYFLS